LVAVEEMVEVRGVRVRAEGEKKGAARPTRKILKPMRGGLGETRRATQEQAKEFQGRVGREGDVKVFMGKDEVKPRCRWALSINERNHEEGEIPPMHRKKKERANGTLTKENGSGKKEAQKSRASSIQRS